MNAFIGSGTVINVVAIIIGSLLGLGLGAKINPSAHKVIMDSLGLVTLLIAALNISYIATSDLSETITKWILILLLASLLIGGLLGSFLMLEERIERYIEKATHTSSQNKIVDGMLTATLVFAVGPLAIIGAMSDGIGTGIDNLVIKSALDFFASLIFAATFGWGVVLSAIPVGLYQGSLTALAYFFGNFLSNAQIATITALGGILLLGVSFRLLEIRRISVINMLPSLVILPLLVSFFE